MKEAKKNLFLCPITFNFRLTTGKTARLDCNDKLLNFALSLAKFRCLSQKVVQKPVNKFTIKTRKQKKFPFFRSRAQRKPQISLNKTSIYLPTRKHLSSLNYTQNLALIKGRQSRCIRLLHFEIFGVFLGRASSLASFHTSFLLLWFTVLRQLLFSPVAPNRV
jgi:hypothetical protein